MQPRSGTSASKSGPILVIDDDPIALQAIADILEGGGFSVHTLVSPIGATQVIASQGIAAAVIDLNMPVMRGDRFITLVRSWDRIRDLPIVLVSGESKSSIQDAISHLPGVLVVTKPQMNELLVATLRRALGVRVDTSIRAIAPTPTHVPIKSEAPVAAAGARALTRLARTTQTAWEDFVSHGTSPLQQLLPALGALQAETRQLGLTNVTDLLTITLQMLDQSKGAKWSSEADAAVSELLTLLVNSSPEKSRGVDRSLALTLLRSRLDRLRQPP